METFSPLLGVPSTKPSFVGCISPPSAITCDYLVEFDFEINGRTYPLELAFSANI